MVTLLSLSLGFSCFPLSVDIITFWSNRGVIRMQRKPAYLSQKGYNVNSHVGQVC